MNIEVTQKINLEPVDYGNNGTRTCLVELDIVGCANTLFIQVPYEEGNSDDEICDMAYQSLCNFIAGDASTERIIKL